MGVLAEIDKKIRAFLNRDRTSGGVGTIFRTPAEMQAWRDLPDPKPSYQEFVGIPEDLTGDEG